MASWFLTLALRDLHLAGVRIRSQGDPLLHRIARWTKTNALARRWRRFHRWAKGKTGFSFEDTKLKKERGWRPGVTRGDRGADQRKALPWQAFAFRSVDAPFHDPPRRYLRLSIVPSQVRKGIQDRPNLGKDPFITSTIDSATATIGKALECLATSVLGC